MFTEKNIDQENRRSRAQIEMNANLTTYFLHFIPFLKTEQVWQALSKQTNKLHKKSAACFHSVIMGFFAALSIHYWVGAACFHINNGTIHVASATRETQWFGHQI